LNKDCMNGGHRSINLNSAPFNLNAKKIFAFSKKAVFFKEN